MKIVLLFITAVFIQVALVLWYPLKLVLMFTSSAEVIEFLAYLVYFGSFVLILKWVYKKYKEL